MYSEMFAKTTFGSTLKLSKVIKQISVSISFLFLQEMKLLLPKMRYFYNKYETLFSI